MVEITKTRVQWIEAAATQLGALPSGQDLSDEDSDTIEFFCDPIARQLSLDGVVDFDTDEIPAEYIIPLTALLANAAATRFGQQYSADVKAENERILRRLTSARPTYETQRAEYF